MYTIERWLWVNVFGHDGLQSRFNTRPSKTHSPYLVVALVPTMVVKRQIKNVNESEEYDIA